MRASKSEAGRDKNFLMLSENGEKTADLLMSWLVSGPAAVPWWCWLRTRRAAPGFASSLGQSCYEWQYARRGRLRMPKPSTSMIDSSWMRCRCHSWQMQAPGLRYHFRSKSCYRRLSRNSDWYVPRVYSYEHCKRMHWMSIRVSLVVFD